MDPQSMYILCIVSPHCTDRVQAVQLGTVNLSDHFQSLLSVPTSEKIIPLCDCSNTYYHCCW